MSTGYKLPVFRIYAEVRRRSCFCDRLRDPAGLVTPNLLNHCLDVSNCNVTRMAGSLPKRVCYIALGNIRGADLFALPS